MGSKAVIAVDDESFAAEVLEADVPVLVEIGAAWCPPCRALEPLVEEAAQKYAGRLKVVALDADASPQTAARLKARGVPTMVLLRGGQEVARQLGLVNRAKLSALLDKHV
jgi:thioredoxin 1